MKIKDAVRLALLYSHQKGWLPSGVWGQDNAGVGPGTKGGVLAETQGLPFAQNTILNERSAAWLPYAAGFLKQPAVGVMQFADYQHNTYDIMKMIGEACWSSGGRVPMPLVLMAAYGALNGKGALYHSQTVENEMVGLPGWKVVSASTPNDAATLLVAAIKDPNPVYFMYPRAHSGFPTDSATTSGLAHLELPGFTLLPGEKELMTQKASLKSHPEAKNQWLAYTTPPHDQRDGSWVQLWPEGLQIPDDHLEQARLRREGDYAVVFSHGRMMPMVWRAAEALSFLTGREIAVMDLRSLKPAPLADMRPLIEQSQGRILWVNEATAKNNWMATLNTEVIREYGWGFETFPRVLSALDSPVAQALVMEKQILPQIEDVFTALCEFFRPEEIRRMSERVDYPLEPHKQDWFDKDELEELARLALAYSEARNPVYSTSLNSLKELVKK